MNLSYVKVFADWTKATAKLKDAEKGRLIDAMVVYATTGEDHSDALSGNEQYLVPMFQASIDRDRQELDDYIQRQSENGKKGGRPRKSENPKNPPVLNKNPKNPPVFEKTQKSQEKEKEYKPPISPSKGDERFDRFWKAYPKRKGKGAALKAFTKLKVTDEMLETMLAAIEAQKKTAQWQKEGGQYIPMPSTWLNQMRWEDDADELPFEPPTEHEEPNWFNSWEAMYR